MVTGWITALLIAQSPGTTDVLLTPGQLADMLQQRNLVLFHIGDQRSKPTYDEGHIAGAQFLNPFADLAAPREEGGLYLELPSAAQLDSVLEARGVSDDSHVVLYTANEYFSPLSRTFFTLEYAGLAGRVSVLDGGLEAWKAEGRPVATDVPTPAPGRFTPRLNRSLVADAAWLGGRLDDPSVAVIDARAPQFYEGADTRQARNGRIPGARNLPFSTVIDEQGRFEPRDTLDGMLRNAGAAPGKTVVTYCHIGQQASLVWFTARLLGYDAKLYDGSFQDWAARSELPVVTGK